jgi:hypothetical protein
MRRGKVAAAPDLADECFRAATRTLLDLQCADVRAMRCDFDRSVSLAMETGDSLGDDGVERTIAIRFLSMIGICLSFVCCSSDAASAAADLLSRIPARFFFF